ncbi:MAG: M20/M25/M40 family metallo-hydrolase [Candidatus Cloacimonadales bacterium]
MNKKLKEYYKNMVAAQGPSGFEYAGQKAYYDFVKEYAQTVESDINGNVVATTKGRSNFSVMIAGHGDEIGFMVNHIDSDGYIYVKVLGGLDVTLLPGLRISLVHEGEVVRAIFGKKAAHMVKKDEKAPDKIEELWLDIGAKNQKEAEKRVSIGDFGTFTPGYEELTDDIVVSKAADNKTGVFVAGLVQYYLSKEKEPILATVHSVSTVCEESNGKGAYTIAEVLKPTIGIAVDVTFASDHPGVDKRVFGDVKIGGGPVIAMGSALNPKVWKMLIETAKEKKIPYQVSVDTNRTGTDADSFFKLNGGIATAVVSIPNRYMHSPNEVVSLSDLENTAKLLFEFVKKIEEDIDLYPFHLS